MAFVIGIFGPSLRHLDAKQDEDPFKATLRTLEEQSERTNGDHTDLLH